MRPIHDPTARCRSWERWALAAITNAYVTNQVLSVDGGTHPR